MSSFFCFETASVCGAYSNLNVAFPQGEFNTVVNGTCMPGYSVFDDNNVPLPGSLPQNTCVLQSDNSTTLWVTSISCEGGLHAAIFSHLFFFSFSSFFFQI